MERRRPIVSCVDELYPPTCAQWISLGVKETLMNFVSNAIGHCTVPESLRVQKVWPGDHQLFWEGLCTRFHSQFYFQFYLHCMKSQQII